MNYETGQGPNRKNRRAMEARARKARAGVPPANIEAIVMQRKFEESLIEALKLRQQNAELQAIAAAILLEVGQDEVVLSPATIDFISNGGVEGLFKAQYPEGGIGISLILAADESDEEE